MWNGAGIWVIIDSWGYCIELQPRFQGLTAIAIYVAGVLVDI